MIVGVLVLIAAALLLRQPLSSWRPWLAVLVFTCINEFIDLQVERWLNPGMQYCEAFKDLLLLSARLLPSLYQPVPPTPRKVNNPSGAISSDS